MTASLAKSKHRRLLSTSRPGLRNFGKGANTTVSSRKTRTVIRSYHTLQKQLHQAQAVGNAELAAKLSVEIDNAGGLQAYQRASIQGQAADRGGDSSRVLVQWLKEAPGGGLNFSASNSTSKTSESSHKLRLLEVGALRPDNTCSQSGFFEVERIDLHSQHPSIREQDFMERPVPGDDTELRVMGFDIVSLSLVVNYIGDPAARGEMLKRVSAFLRVQQHESGQEKGEQLSRWLPGLFFVLPAPCVINSRYLDEKRLVIIMASLGFELRRSKTSSKLVYYYFVYHHDTIARISEHYGKRAIRTGRTRNNFAIVI